ncbi:MAG: addiction module toxin RelE [Chloroflexi bacterium]|nr:MAG: addiction module toxin RelE [Chloroflexota bacterium]
MAIRYEIIFAQATREHLTFIERHYYSLIYQTTVEQLQYDPMVETHNRKPLKKPSEIGATWELRFGPNNRFRVLYEVLPDDGKVHILAVGVKQGNRLLVGGKEIKL